MLTTTMVAVPGPTCYPDVVQHHHQMSQPMQPAPPMSQPATVNSIPQQPLQYSHPNNQKQQQETSRSTTPSPTTAPGDQMPSVNHNHVNPHPQPLATIPPPPLMHQPQMALTIPVPLNHSTMNNTTLTNSTAIPVVTSTIDMSGQPPHQFNPNQPPPPFCQPEYYGGEFYQEYCPTATHMCAVHGVPPGPATVRMVSTNSNPPIALPVQVPAGHVVQQIVDETGTLQHVILSTQLPNMSLCYHGGNTGGSGPHQFYGPPPPPHPGGGPPPPQGYVTSFQPTPPQYSPVMTPPPLSQPSPPPHNFQKQDRSRQYDKPRGGKFYSRQHYGGRGGGGSIQNTPPLSPKKDDTGQKIRSDEEQTTQEAQQQEFEAQLASILTQLPPVEVNNITPRSATLHWSEPPIHLLQDAEEYLSGCELSYEVYLDSTLVTTVRQLSTSLQGLRPGTEYTVQLCCICGTVRSSSFCAEQVFCTQSTIPEQPAPPRLISKSKVSLHIKWVSPRDGGSRITMHVVELMDCGGEATAAAAALRAVASSERNVAGVWREVYRGRGRDVTLNKLTPATGYRIRMAAINQNGPSPWSIDLTCSTAGLPPPQPAPPSLACAEVTSLSLTWASICDSHSYILKMEDSFSGYGFMPVYRGTDNSFCCSKLKRNTDYKFKLIAENEEGESQVSDIVCYRTLPDKPGAPTPPTIKGRPKTHYLRLCWSPPSDHGGSCITQYRLTIDKGKGFEVVYAGELCECDCHELQPGTSYQVRAQAVSLGGQGPWSDVSTVTTDPVAPHQCLPPTLNAKPKAHLLQLKWAHVPCDGGSPVLEYNVEMMTSDSDRRLVYTGKETYCTVAGLLPGRPYIFLVRAVNRVGPGQWSEPFEAVSGAGPPDAPKAPQLACKGPHVVSAQWDEPINNGAKIDSYTVEVAEVTPSHPESSESSSTCGDFDHTELSFSTATTSTSAQADVRHLLPDTSYAIRVGGSNIAGIGPFSPHSVITTPPSAPSAPPHISTTSTCNTITLHWTEPKNNGDPVQHYIVEVMDGKSYSTEGPVLEYTVPDLLPDTSYRVRVQAVNAVGVGCFSAPHKCHTRPLPPSPPPIELVKASYNWLKISWGDKKQNYLSPEPLTFCLQMEFPNPHSSSKEFYQVYNGSGNSYKLTKLEEATVYRLRICAANQTEVGPNSEPVEFKTTRAPPPAPKAPRQTEQSSDGSAGFLVEWCPVRCFNDDPVTYVLQARVATREHEYTTVYTGSSTSYLLRNLSPNSLYNVRVCGVRRCVDGEELMGAYSSPLVFFTPKVAVQQKTQSDVPETEAVQTGSVVSKLSRRPLSDTETAMLLVLVFSLFAVLLAYALFPTLNG